MSSGFGPRLRSFASDAALYGVANILARVLTFLLVPLHTGVLTPAEYGPIGTIYGYIVVLTVLYGFGLETAYLRFAAPDRVTSERDVFSTPTWFIAAIGLSGSLLVTALRDPIAHAIGLPGLGHYVAIAAWIVVFDTVPIAALSWLRLNRRAGTFAAIRVTSLLLYVALTVLFLVKLRHGAVGILEANLAASFSELVLLLPVFFRLLKFRIDGKQLRQLLGFSLPLVPAGLAAVVLQFADRPILQKLTSDAEVGIYQANAKLAFPMLMLVTVFQYAWQPFFLTRSGDADARPLFARMLVYQLVAALGAFLMISLFVDQLVAIPLGGGRTLIDADYWSGLGVVPWLALAYACLGIYTNLGAGPTLQGKTHTFMWVSAVAAVIDIALAILLVPMVGSIGVAYATCIASIALAAGMWYLSHRLYPLEHEWTRLLQVAVCGLGPWLLFRGLGGAELGILPRIGLVALYPTALLASGFLQRDEVQELRAAVTAVRARWRAR